MAASVVLTAMGSDRPGLTRALAEAVQGAGGNWLESQLARLGGKFVGAVLVEIGEDDLDRLAQAVRAIDPATLTVEIVEAAGARGEGRPLSIELVGADRPGIVREVTTVLAAQGVNIETLETSAQSGAWSGERLFRAKAQLLVPPGTEPDQVTEALEAISGEIMVDITVSPARARA